MNNSTCKERGPKHASAFMRRISMWTTVAFQIICLSSHGADLIEIVKGGDEEAVKAVLVEKPNLNATDIRGRTALMLAAINGKSAIVAQLLEAGANPGVKDGDGKTARDLADGLGNNEVVKLIDKHLGEKQGQANPTALLVQALDGRNFPLAIKAIESGADINTKVIGLKTFLILAAEEQNVAAVRFAVEHGAHVNAVDREKKSALYTVQEWAGKDAQLEEIEQLLLKAGAVTKAAELNRSLGQAVESSDIDLINAALSKKADPNHFAGEGVNILSVAVRNRNRETINLLLSKGANPNMQLLDDGSSQNAFHQAVQVGDQDIVRLLIERGAKPDMPTMNGQTPLLLAASTKEGVSVIPLLLAYKPNVNAVDERTGRTVLHQATVNGAPKNVLNDLLNAGADPKAVDKQGYDSLMLAAKYGWLGSVSLFLEKGVNDEKSRAIALMRAVQAGKPQVVQLLLTNGVDPNFTVDRISPMDLAAKLGREDMIKILVQAGAKAQETTGDTDPPIDATQLTRSDFKKAVAPFNSAERQFKGRFLSETGFTKRFGKPNKTQSLGDYAYWYYKCSDGLCQIVIDKVFLQTQGVVIKEINDTE